MTDKRTVFRCLTVALTLFVGGGLLEFTIRARAPQFVFHDSPAFYQDDPEFGWTYRKSLHTSAYDPFLEKNVLVDINADGFRERSLSEFVDRPKPTVLFLGDSLTGALQVAASERFSALAGAALGVQPVNMGVNGYSTDQIVLVLQKYGPRFKPRTIVYALCFNDLMGNMQRTVEVDDYLYGKPTFDENLVLQPRPFAKVLNHERQSVSAGGALIAPFKRYARQHSALYNFVGGLNYRIHARLKKEELAVGQVNISAFMDGPRQVAQFAQMEKLLARLQAESARLGSQLVVIPEPHLVYLNPDIAAILERFYAQQGIAVDFERPRRELRRIASAQHVALIDWAPARLRAVERDTGPLQWIRGGVVFDQHLTPAGHQAFAALIVQALTASSRSTCAGLADDDQIGVVNAQPCNSLGDSGIQ